MCQSRQNSRGLRDSSGSRNFGAVRSQLVNYGNILLEADQTLMPADPLNRIGEERARVEALLHLLDDKFLPSIPPAPGGFVEDLGNTVWAQMPERP